MTSPTLLKPDSVATLSIVRAGWLSVLVKVQVTVSPATKGIPTEGSLFGRALSDETHSFLVRVYVELAASVTLYCVFETEGGTQFIPAPQLSFEPPSFSVNVAGNVPLGNPLVLNVKSVLVSPLGTVTFLTMTLPLVSLIEVLVNVQV
jgi:hypothetical protein